MPSVNFSDLDTGEPIYGLDGGNSRKVYPIVVRTESGAVATPMVLKFRERRSIEDFGGSTSASAATNTTAITNALASFGTDGGELHFGAGEYDYTGPISMPSGKAITLVGAGPGITILNNTSATANGVEFHHSSLFNGGGGIRGLTVQAGGGGTDTESTGVGVSLLRCGDNFVCDAFDITNYATGFKYDSCWNNRYTNGRVLHSSTAGILRPTGTDGNTGGNYFFNWKLSNLGFTGVNTASIGLNIRESSGDIFINLDTTVFEKGFVADPATGKSVLYLFCENVLCDTSDDDSWTFDATNGTILSINLVNCWGAYSTNGSGLVTKGSNLNSLMFQGRLRENGKHGWDHQGGINCTVYSSEVAHNSKLTDNTYHGVSVSANVNDWAVLGCRIGNFASSESNTQANSVFVASGTSTRYRILNNDMSNPGSGKVALVDGGTGTVKYIANNVPVGANGELPATIASAGTVTLSSVTTKVINISGSTGPITSLGGSADLGDRRLLVFASTPTLTHNATSLILPTSADITAAAGDVAEFVHEGSGNWRCVSYRRASGGSVGAFLPPSNDGGALGASGTAWSDLFLALGGVINWNAGDVTATHSADALAFAGAASGYSFSTTNTGTSNVAAVTASMTRSTTAGSGGIFSGMTLNVTDNGTVAALSNQAFRLNMTLAATTPSSAFDVAAALNTTVNENVTLAMGQQIAGPAVASGKTLTTWYGLTTTASSGLGSVTNKKSIYVQANSGVVDIEDTNGLTSAGKVVSRSASAGIGYATGAGGTVTQATSKSTAVTLNTATGTITMNGAALAADTIVSFTLNNSAIAATDQIYVTHESVGTTGAYTVNGRATGAGTGAIDVRNNTAGSLSEAIVLRFSVIKSVNA